MHLRVFGPHACLQAKQIYNTIFYFDTPPKFLEELWCCHTYSYYRTLATIMCTISINCLDKGLKSYLDSLDEEY